MKKFYPFFFISVFLILAQYSCSKIDTTDIGSNLIPAVDNVNTFDTTLDVFTNNDFLIDTTAILYNEDHALGQVSDLDFGTTRGDIYAGFVSPVYGSHPFYAKDSVKGIDSVVLMLSYKGLYGDSMTAQNYTVTEIDPASDFKDSLSGYRINSPDFPLTGAQLANQSVDLTTLNDSIVIIRKTDTTKLVNVMRIRLNNSIGQKLASLDTATAYKNDSTFKTIFKGLAIKAGGSGQALAYFNLQDANSQLIIYYRAQKAGVTDTAQASFVFAPYMQANLVRRTPAGAYLANVTNATVNDQYLYLQSTPGSYGSIKIPGLKGLTNRVVHRAELIVEKEPSVTNQNDIFLPPPSLFLDAIDSANSNRILAIPNYDFSASNGSYNLLEFGGLARSDDSYRFSLTRFVQGIVTRAETSYTLRLHAAYYLNPYYKDPQYGLIPYPLTLSTKIAYGRVVVKGGGYPDAKKKMRLRIIYSKI